MTEKTILFYRDLTTYTGGHQKVADYFQHLQSSQQYCAQIAFSSRSRWDPLNPWFSEHEQKNIVYEPSAANYIFLAGMDWVQYLRNPPATSKPIINLIQHVRHADANEDVYKFLGEPAVRICVSPEVADAITATGKVNGPVFTIPNGIALPAIKNAQKNYDLFILGTKNPALAQKILNSLRGKNLRICLVDEFIPREDLREKMAQSRIALLLPNSTEGFYLPALEAMHFCELTIVPDCVGNRSFCRNGENCLMPEYNELALLNAIVRAQTILNEQSKLTGLQKFAHDTVVAHSLERERAAFLAVMNDLDKLWASLPAH